MSTICIITARAGSKRTPGKNIRDFCGKPMMAYSIQAALDSGLFDEVMVSTDSEQYAEIAKQYGANVPFLRSEATSNDFAGTWDVIKEVMSEYQKQGRVFDNICCIYPCAPFVTGEILKDAYQKFITTDCDSLRPMVKFSSPPQRGQYIRDGRLVSITSEFNNWRTQDIEPIYHDPGQFYFWKGYLYYGGQKSRGITIPYVVDDELAQDIDNESDFRIAELKYRAFVLHEFDK